MEKKEPKKKRKNVPRRRDDNGRFIPGSSGNPSGRPALPYEYQEIKSLSVTYVQKVVSKLAMMDNIDMEEWILKPLVEGGPNNLERIIASIILKAQKEGDHNKLNFLLDRTIGKVVENRKIEVEAVKYVTKVRADGSLLQEVVLEELGSGD